MAKKTAKKAKKSKSTVKGTRKASPARTKQPASAKKAKKSARKPAKKAAKKQNKAAKNTKKAAKKVVKKASQPRKVKTSSSPKKTAAKTAGVAKSKGTQKKVKKPTQAKRPKKSRMTKAQLEPYKKLLLDRKADLARQVLAQNDDMDDLREDQPADPLDMALNTSSLELMTALGNNERMELSEINEALNKIENGTFGICESCIVEPLNLCATCPSIPPARLEALPTARFCVQVKEQQERTPGIYADRPRRRAALLGDDLVVTSDDE